MALREIIWTVSKDVRSLTPNTPQDGGVQGEHNATKAVFVIPDGCALQDEKYQLYYTWVNASGCYDKTEPLTIEAGRVSFDLPREWTQYGGINTITLVAEADGEVVYTLEGRVTFHSRQTAHKRERHLLEGFMQEKCDEAAAHVAAAKFHEQNADEYNEEARMWARDAAKAAADAESAAEQAAQSANTAESHGRYADEASLAAKEYAEQANRAAEEAAMAIPVVDDALSETSANPVQNKVVTQRLNEVANGASLANFSAKRAQETADKAMETARSAGQLASSVENRLNYDVIPRIDDLESKGLLIVTYTNVDDMTATHNAAEIYAHIQNGGTAVFFDGGIYYNLITVDEYTATFNYIGDDMCNTLFVIDDSAGVEVVDLQYASAEWVAELEDSVNETEATIEYAYPRTTCVIDLIENDGECGLKNLAPTAQTVKLETMFVPQNLINLTGINKTIDGLSVYSLYRGTNVTNYPHYELKISGTCTSNVTLEFDMVDFVNQDQVPICASHRGRGSFVSDRISLSFEDDSGKIHECPKGSLYVIVEGLERVTKAILTIAAGKYSNATIEPIITPGAWKISDNTNGTEDWWPPYEPAFYFPAYYTDDVVISWPNDGNVQYPDVTATYRTTIDSVMELNDDRMAALETAAADIDTALDRIIAIQEELIGTITFTDGINTFTALEGMTFGEWVNSKYNTIGAIVNDYNYIWWPEDDSILYLLGGNPLTSTEVILDGVECEWT